jgi:hypothetical protein
MGAGCGRFLYGQCESVPRITTTFPYWFSPRLNAAADLVEQLPFDQHTVKALVAPRALLSTEAMGDAWANPPGTQLTHQAARVVYQWLGVPERIGSHFREGVHEHNADDWRVLLDFADRVLRGQRVLRRFDPLAYPDEAPRGFAWREPRRR